MLGEARQRALKTGKFEYFLLHFVVVITQRIMPASSISTS
jgi:hypothetical protein